MTITEHRIRCATCADGQHETVEEVRACAMGSAQSAQERADDLPEGLYEKNGQRFRVKTSRRNGHKFAMLQDPGTHRFEYVPGAIKTLSREHLVKLADGRLRDIDAPRQDQPEPEEGIYQHPETQEILKVYRAVHGSGQMCAKRLNMPVEVADAYGEPRFEYLGLAVSHLNGHQKLSLEEAQEFGRLYGFCVRCAAPLTDEESIARGLGPVCASKGWAA